MGKTFKADKQFQMRRSSPRQNLIKVDEVLGSNLIILDRTVFGHYVSILSYVVGSFLSGLIATDYFRFKLLLALLSVLVNSGQIWSNLDFFLFFKIE